MNCELLQVKENEVVTNSLIVAEKFNKEHKNVISKIEALISQIEDGSKLSRPNFFEKTYYTNVQNKPQPMYYIGRDGFSLLVMGFTGKEALEWKLKYIEAFNDMEEVIRSGGLPDKRLELARLIATLSDKKVDLIRDLYPEYFSHTPEVGSLEYRSDINTAYRRWIEDLNVTVEWISEFPTTDIFINYLNYCKDINCPSMGKKTFYKTLALDFNLTRRQKSDKFRYFLTA